MEIKFIKDFTIHGEYSVPSGQDYLTSARAPYGQVNLTSAGGVLSPEVGNPNHMVLTPEVRGQVILTK